MFCFQDTELKAIFLKFHNQFLYAFLHSQSGLSPLIHLLRLYSAFAGHNSSNPALLFSPLNKFSKKGSSLKQGFPQGPAYHIFFRWLHRDELFTPSCEATVWCSWEQGLRSPCACRDALGDHQWSLVLNLHLSAPGNVPNTHRHFPLENVGKMARKKACGGFPSFPQIVRQTDTVF